MIALAAKDQEQVVAVHAFALAHGVANEGAPGRRGRSFYGGYFREPNGNKFSINLTLLQKIGTLTSNGIGQNDFAYQSAPF